jgi:hypothetical protein
MFGEVPAAALTPPAFEGSGFGSPDLPDRASGGKRSRTTPKPVR